MSNKKRNRIVVSVNIVTGEIRHWDSITQVSKFLDVNVITIRRAIQNIKAANGYIFCNPGDEHRASELAEYMRKNGIQSPQRGRRKKDGMVWLQIDSHTRIRVRRDEATPEFAIEYTKRLKGKQSSS